MSPPVLEFSLAKPNTDKLRIPPIADLLRLFMGRGDGWADLFAGSNCPAQHKNDRNHRRNDEAADFLARFPDESLQGVILDPLGKVPANKESGEGMVSNVGDTWKVKDVAAKKIMPGGLAICCGQDSNGLGEKRGFERIHVLGVQHGSDHADTIVTVEIKVPYQAADDPTECYPSNENPVLY